MSHPLISIIMGSDSDLPVMRQAADFLKSQDIPFELTVVSAHRTPQRMFQFAQEAHHVTVGFKRMTEGGSLFEFGIQQNITRYENSTDLAFRFSAIGRF